MAHRLTKIYTRTGDSGTTGLGDGSRVDKDHARVEAMGCIDELNSALGFILGVRSVPKSITDIIQDLQHDLFDLGAELSLPDSHIISSAQVQHLEELIDKFNLNLPYLKEFILPGGGPAAATCHLARSICRRAERRLVTLQHHNAVNQQSLAYINRLSDLLFVIARFLNQPRKQRETAWRQPPSPPKKPD